MKTCGNCEEAKPLDAFGRLARSRDGLNRLCKSCARGYFSGYRTENRQKIRGISSKWFAANRDLANGRSAKWRAENPERQRQAEVNYRASNPDRRRASVAAHRAKPGVSEREKLTRKAWCERNKARLAAKTAARRAAILQATPPWVDREEIVRIYAEAQRITVTTGIPHEVDHHYPLKGKNSCGLHVPWNLRIITGPHNRRKSNREPEACQA